MCLAIAIVSVIFQSDHEMHSCCTILLKDSLYHVLSVCHKILYNYDFNLEGVYFVPLAISRPNSISNYILFVPPNIYSTHDLSSCFFYVRKIPIHSYSTTSHLCNLHLIV